MRISHSLVTDVKEMGKVFTFLTPENLFYTARFSRLCCQVSSLREVSTLDKGKKEHSG